MVGGTLLLLALAADKPVVVAGALCSLAFGLGLVFGVDYGRRHPRR
jgi:hypothetical protein